MNKISPLLTIAIPTWNRAETLNRALGFLLPQISQFKDEVEIVVSDNASDDNTQEIVNHYVVIYTELKIVYNRNSENIKFFGNFRKCRELARGEFIWLLSDDDFVCNNVVDEIMNNLLANRNYAVIYLKNSHNLISLKTTILTSEELIKKETFRIGLISSVVFLNNKVNDEFLLSKYSESNFIGFIFVLNSFNFRNMILSIQGKCLNAANDIPKGYNFFDVFVNHMEHVVEYMSYIGFSVKLIRHFRRSFLINFILPIYILFKAEKKLSFGDFQSSSLKETDFWIYERYHDLSIYWLIFYPFVLAPSILLTLSLKFRRLLK